MALDHELPTLFDRIETVCQDELLARGKAGEQALQWLREPYAADRGPFIDALEEVLMANHPTRETPRYTGAHDRHHQRLTTSGDANLTVFWAPGHDPSPLVDCGVLDNNRHWCAPRLTTLVVLGPTNAATNDLVGNLHADATAAAGRIVVLNHHEPWLARVGQFTASTGHPTARACGALEAADLHNVGELGAWLDGDDHQLTAADFSSSSDGPTLLDDVHALAWLDATDTDFYVVCGKETDRYGAHGNVLSVAPGDTVVADRGKNCLTANDRSLLQADERLDSARGRLDVLLSARRLIAAVDAVTTT